jgi:hypothetical protein
MFCLFFSSPLLSSPLLSSPLLSTLSILFPTTLRPRRQTLQVTRDERVLLGSERVGEDEAGNE